MRINIVAGREGMGFYAEEFSGPFAAADPLVNVPTVFAIHRALASKGITLVFVIVPIKARIYENYLSQQLPKSILNRYDVVRNTLEANGVLTPDINTYLLHHPARNSNQPLYFFADTHWTPQTSFDIGEFVAQEIAHHVILDNIPVMPMNKEIKSAQISGLLQMLEGSGDGDILRVCTADNPACPKIKPLTNVKLITMTSRLRLLERTPPPQIIQTGTSYSVNDALANGLRNGLQRDVLLVARDGGWYSAFKDYLASKDFQINPPRIIVWEYPERSLAVAFESQDPSQMVADILGWCEAGTSPDEIVPIKSEANSETFDLKFDHPIRGTYLTLKTNAPSGTIMKLENPQNASQKTTIKQIKMTGAPNSQVLLEQIVRATTTRLRVTFQAASPKQGSQTKINHASVCTNSLR